MNAQFVLIEGLYEDAVNLALTIDIDLAKEIADTQDEIINDELKRKLWLRIARHIIEEKNDVSKAMLLIDECDSIIQIEDILPYFPDFVTIDDFKDAIRDSLATYTRTISTLKDDIEQAAQSAQSIREDIQLVKAKSLCINANDRCVICKFTLITRSFYVFPCAHKFHSDCLYAAVQPHLIPSKSRKVDELQRSLKDFSTQTMPKPTPIATHHQQSQPSLKLVDTLNQKLFHNTNRRLEQKRISDTGVVYTNDDIERIRNELDELLASECIFCGEFLINTVDEPFFNFDNYEAIFQSWL